MIESITRHATRLGVLAAVAAFLLAIPEATAKLSKPQMKRCLTGRFPVDLSAIIQVLFLDGPPRPDILVDEEDILPLGGRKAKFDQFRFDFRRKSVRGQRKVVIRGSAQIPSLINNLPGSLKIVIVKRGRKARITTGTFTLEGTDPDTGLANRVTNGKIEGSKRLQKRCLR